MNNPSIFSALRKDREGMRGGRCGGGDVVSGRGEGQALSRPPLHRALAVPFGQERERKRGRDNEEERGTGKKALMGSGWRRTCGYMDKDKKDSLFGLLASVSKAFPPSIDAAFHKRLINQAPSPSTDITCRSPLIETTSGNAAQLRLRTRSLSPPLPPLPSRQNSPS